MPKQSTHDDESPNCSALEEVELLRPEEAGALKRILTLSTDPDEEVRMRAIERFVEFPKADVHDRAVQALQDTDQFVRIEALESLGFWADKSDYKSIVKRVDDDEELVRCAAADALGNIGNTDALRILELRSVSGAERERVSIFAAIRRIDPSNQKALWSLLDLLRSSDYRVRCAAANSVEMRLHIANDISEIKRRLDAALNNEDTAAARSSVKAARMRISHFSESYQN